MPRMWWIPLLLIVAAVALAQQAADEPTDRERIAQLETQVSAMQRMLADDGVVEMTPALLNARLTRIEMRLDRLEQQAIRSSGGADASAGRMMDSRLRSLENAVMRLQQQR